MEKEKKEIGKLLELLNEYEIEKEKSELEWYDFIELFFGIILCAGLGIIVIAFIISAIVGIIQGVNQTF